MSIKKKIKRICKNYFSKTTSIKVPVYEGELLNGKTALITGGTSGIGYEIAKSFLKNGASVVLTGRNKDKINNAIDSLKKYVKDDNTVLGIEMDISNISMIEDKFKKILELLNDRNIDILVNNAGIVKGKKIGSGSKTSIDDYEVVLKTNLEGPYFLSQEVANYMKEKKIKGNILNILSSSALRPAVKPYTVSKWGLRGLTIGMAKRFIKDGIVVNGIAPGPTATPMLISNDKDGDLSLESSPVGRYILPEEIANLAVFMVSDMGRMIVGDIVYMTGGAGIVTVDDINY